VNAAGWTISIISILIVAAIALNISRLAPLSSVVRVRRRRGGRRRRPCHTVGVGFIVPDLPPG
jgi:hypothetical protein